MTGIHYIIVTDSSGDVHETELFDNFDLAHISYTKYRSEAPYNDGRFKVSMGHQTPTSKEKTMW